MDLSLKGEVKANSAKELVITSQNKDYALSYEEVKSSVTVFDPSKKQDGGKILRLKKEDIKPKDQVQLDISINPDSGKFESYAIVRVAK